MLILLFIVDLVAATARQEKPTLMDVRPDATLMDHVARPSDVQDAADALVLVHPIKVSHLQLYLHLLKCTLCHIIGLCC